MDAGSSRQQASAAARAAAALAACVVLVVAGAAAMAFLSSLYASAARDLVRNSAGTESGIDAAELSVRFAPWRAQSRLGLAQSLSADGHIDEAATQVTQAVRLLAADGYAWAYLARVLGSRQPDPARLLGAYQMALQRSPHTAPVHWSIALDGVRRWRSGNAELRTLWRASMARSLRHNRGAFLKQVFALGRDPYWCAAHRTELPIAKWCEQTAAIRRTCAAPNLPPKAAARCGEIGITPPRP